MADQDVIKQQRLSSVVDEWLTFNDLTAHWFSKYLAVAIHGLSELKLDVAGDLVACILPVNDRKVVILPGDFHEYSVVGIPNGQYYIPLGENKKLRNDVRTDQKPSTTYPYLNNELPNGIDVGNYTGVHTFDFTGSPYAGQLPTRGSFRIEKDKECSKILLDYNYPLQEIYLEYTNNGFDSKGETIVDADLRDYVYKYLDLFFEEKNNPKKTESSIRRYETKLLDAERKVRARKNDLTPATMNNIRRTGIRLTPRI